MRQRLLSHVVQAVAEGSSDRKETEFIIPSSDLYMEQLQLSQINPVIWSIGDAESWEKVDHMVFEFGVSTCIFTNLPLVVILLLCLPTFRCKRRNHFV